MLLLSAAAAALVLASCSAEPPAEPEAGETSEAESGWTLSSQGEVEMLALAGGGGEASLRLICTSDGRFRVNVPAFRPVGSEERMTFGQRASVETLVADPSGDARLGGVSAEGPVPEKLASLLSGRTAVNYGSQNSGPHRQIPEDLRRRFLDSCKPADQQARTDQEEKVSACLIKDGKRVPDISLWAIGTEPFWRADIRGRCVTYRTPENQDGTRIWTEFDGSHDSGVWAGFYGNQRFVLRTHPDQDCSDGMSDKVYPIGVSLAVEGEERTGCADYR